MQDVTPDMQDGGAPPELHSLPEAHGVITPPSTFAPEASPGVNNERESCARLNEEVEMEMDDDSAFAEEEDTDYIEVGPDGLRTTEDCVASVFDPQKNFVCRFCEYVSVSFYFFISFSFGTQPMSCFRTTGYLFTPQGTV
jgi:hypothetical protein